MFMSFETFQYAAPGKNVCCPQFVFISIGRKAHTSLKLYIDVRCGHMVVKSQNCRLNTHTQRMSVCVYLYVGYATSLRGWGYTKTR